MTSNADRFWSKAFIDPWTKCWTWTASGRGNDYSKYGQFWLNGQMRLAHRVAWSLANDQEVPEGMCVLHDCDVPCCVNPAHLYIGNHTDNMRDKRVRGRASRLQGESHPLAKLTDSDVLEIRRLHCEGELTNRYLGSMFGVSKDMVQRIVTRKNWKHIPPESE